MKSILPAILIVLLVIPGLAHAQGEFMQRGAHGMMIGGGIRPTLDGSTYSAGVGFSLYGTLDLLVNHNWVDETPDTLMFEISGRAIEPGVNLHLIKQGPTYPFSLSAVSRYEFLGREAAETSTEEADVNGRRFRVGGLLHTVFQIRDVIGMRPWFGILYSHRTHEYIFADESGLTIDGDDTEYHLGLQLVVMPTHRSVFFVGPSVMFARGDRVSGISAGLVFN